MSAPRLTKEQAEVLSSEAKRPPLSPVPCECCGVAVPDEGGGSRPKFTQAERTTLRLDWPLARRRYGRCGACHEARAQAEAYLAASPALVARYGGVALELVESLIFAMQVLDQPMPKDVGFALPRMLTALPEIRFKQPAHLGDRKGMNSRPWGHVTPEKRLDLKRAQAGVMRDRLALGSPPVQVRCPSGGCVLCGVSTVSRSAVELARRGGDIDSLVPVVWREVTTHSFSGHACPTCAVAADSAGSYGASAATNAALTYLNTLGRRQEVARYKRAIEDEVIPPVQPWAMKRGAKSRSEPWLDALQALDRAWTEATMRRGPVEVA